MKYKKSKPCTMKSKSKAKAKAKSKPMYKKKK